MKTQLAGRRGEAAAAEFLRKKGYEILEANFHTRFGEIDLIAKKKSTVVFVEVKMRRDRRFMSAFEAVNAQKQAKIRVTAEEWLARNDPGEHLGARFDVVEVYLNEPGTGLTINHIENAFSSAGYQE